MTARVLVVDDMPVNIRLLEAKLSAEYFHVLSAASGAEALEKVRQELPDIVLLDVMMPGLDGWLAALKEQGNEVTGISDFDAAMNEARNVPHDLIIVNISMQRFDGLRICSELRAIPALRSTPVMVLVGPGENKKLAQALDLGANDYLHLPLDRSEF